MGAWGTELWEDDLSCDIQDEWNELIDEGNSPKKATKIILDSWLDEFQDDDNEEDVLADLSILYISLAALQMRQKALQNKIKKKALEYLEKGADLHLWEDGNEKDLKDRKKVLYEFKMKLIAFKPKLL
ncbi:MarR family transcriptional regulator [Chengkuizengella marina]|uniref:MarR family transcriptional regulator n=1 Tax=Chengkuizengella marina TaxID=2507566 RepID=A0A6N9Q5V1_9BACL|nr:MarR family transcriptional regulator [Chengkuizengella marina]NBI30212.1 MarR family transcriptional regulator [Chengkuizengella marina]